MKVEIYGEETKDVVLRLRLVKNGRDGVDLVQVDSSGYAEYTILAINSDGEVELYKSCDLAARAKVKLDGDFPTVNKFY